MVGVSEIKCQRPICPSAAPGEGASVNTAEYPARVVRE